MALTIALTITGFILVLGVVIFVSCSRRVWLGTPAHGLKKVKCKFCTGSKQALLKRGWDDQPTWGKIPVELRQLVRDGGDDIHNPPLANIRNCPHCANMGWTLKPKDL